VSPRRRRRAIVALLAVALTAAIAGAQRGRYAWLEPNAKYDGRFTFVRLRYQVLWRSGWEYDYPTMERNLMAIVRELTSIRPHMRESNVLDMDDPELFRYPVAYLSEPGFWVPSESGTIRAATDAADPLEEPPGVHARFHGFRVGAGSYVANSVVWSLPSRIPPASLSRATDVAS